LTNESNKIKTNSENLKGEFVSEFGHVINIVCVVVVVVVK
jgi:hypothetical protein